MNIKEFDKSSLKDLRYEYQAAIDAVSKKYGLKAQLGNIRFDRSEFNCKMTVKTLSAAAPRVINIPDSGLVGKRFKHKNSIYHIQGVDSPGMVIAYTQRGKGYKIKVSQLAEMKEL